MLSQSNSLKQQQLSPNQKKVVGQQNIASASKKQGMRPPTINSANNGPSTNGAPFAISIESGGSTSKVMNKLANSASKNLSAA